jgi:hypothetical protein
MAANNRWVLLLVFLIISSTTGKNVRHDIKRIKRHKRDVVETQLIDLNSYIRLM